MSKGKYSRKRGMNLRPLILVLTVALLLGATIGGTIAWLTATTEEVENTFTVGDISIKLEEKELTYDENDDPVYGETTTNVSNNYKLIPGQEYTKDPVVTVIDTTDVKSEDCYLFVKAVETNEPSKYLTYGYMMEDDATDPANNGWTMLEESEDETAKTKTIVWYRVVEKNAANKVFHLLDNDKVTVKSTIVKASTPADALKNGEVKMPASNAQPKLEFTAYAIQKDNIGIASNTEAQNAALAWAEVNK